MEIGDSGRIAAAERGEMRGVRQGVAILTLIEARAECLALLVGDD